MNYLYYGDNLDVLRRHIKDETVDLVYLDPPFNSSQDYNVLFSEHNGTGSKAQMKAFEDTWRWDEVAAKAYADTLRAAARWLMLFGPSGPSWAAVTCSPTCP